jgi:ABC-type Zn uptake system ZnuABC Zn-binding protein ZnuA
MLVGLVGCSRVVDPWQDTPGAPRVVVTIAPLYSFVKAVAGDRAAVKCLCKDRGPHHFQSDLRDAVVLQRADLFLAVGLTLDDSFADSLAQQSGKPGLPYVRLGPKLHSLLIPIQGKVRHGDHYHEGGHDPHVWLGVEQAVAMVEMVRDELGKVDPPNKAEYDQNAAAYVQKLVRLRDDGRKLLAGKKHKRIITFHDSLRYFAKSFGLTIADVIETAPGAEPSAQDLKRLTELCQKAKTDGDPIAVIAVEPQYASSTAATKLQDELKAPQRGVDVKLVEVDPLETADPAQLEGLGAGWYEAQMRRNLEALAQELP